MQLFIDEAGRGPLAWPLYIGIVKKIKNPEKFIANPLFTDSKKLSPSKRTLAYQEIKKLIESWEIEAQTASIDAHFIDSYGITRAINIAICKGILHFIQTKQESWIHQPFYPFFKQALKKRETTHRKSPELVIDGKTDFKLHQELGLNIQTIIQGDSKVLEISIASILAKVERDLEMEKIAKQYPQYLFEKHKGYWTKLHYEMIEKFWTCQEHRKLFLKKLIPEWKISPFNDEITNIT